MDPQAVFAIEDVRVKVRFNVEPLQPAIGEPLLLTATIRDQRLFVFRCSHFDWEARACDSYSSRPGMCRDYPRGLLDLAIPEFFEECGYRPIARNAEEMTALLEQQGLPEAELVQLKRKLHLE